MVSLAPYHVGWVWNFVSFLCYQFMKFMALQWDKFLIWFRLVDFFFSVFPFLSDFPEIFVFHKGIWLIRFPLFLAGNQI